MDDRRSRALAMFVLLLPLAAWLLAQEQRTRSYGRVVIDGTFSQASSEDGKTLHVGQSTSGGPIEGVEVIAPEGRAVLARLEGKRLQLTFGAPIPTPTASPSQPAAPEPSAPATPSLKPGSHASPSSGPSRTPNRGHGRNVTGGTGGRVFTLGPASTEADLRRFLMGQGPRIITCLAGMAPPVYPLTREVVVQAATDITFDGEPCGGITVVKAANAQRPGGKRQTFNGISFRNGGGNIWIRYVRFIGDYEPGTLPTPLVNNSSGLEFDGDGPYPAWCIRGVYLEHIVTTRGVDSNPDLYGCVIDVTYDSIFAYENLHPNTDSDSNGRKPRKNHSFIENLYALNGERNPQLRHDLDSVDYANNVVYGWAATYYGALPPSGPGSYGVKVEDDAGNFKNPRNVVFRGNAFVSGPLSVVRNGQGAVVVDHRGWDLIYGTKAGCDAGGAPADPHRCNPRLSIGALRSTDNLFDPRHSKYDGFTTNAGQQLSDPPYPLDIRSSRDLETVILNAGIPGHETPREAEVRSEALAAYRARLARGREPR